ncbi:MAG: hypothetical protein JWM43_4107 [Acidobacteriaceae bacterium]|nr:hypothetical protein [Acidobacteriaceae bacterium]
MLKYFRQAQVFCYRRSFLGCGSPSRCSARFRSSTSRLDSSRWSRNVRASGTGSCAASSCMEARVRACGDGAASPCAGGTRAGGVWLRFPVEFFGPGWLSSPGRAFSGATPLDCPTPANEREERAIVRIPMPKPVESLRMVPPLPGFDADSIWNVLFVHEPLPCEASQTSPAGSAKIGRTFL